MEIEVMYIITGTVFLGDRECDIWCNETTTMAFVYTVNIFRSYYKISFLFPYSDMDVKGLPGDVLSSRREEIYHSGSLLIPCHTKHLLSVYLPCFFLQFITP